MAEDKNIVAFSQKINKVVEAVSGIVKTGKNKMQHYDYVEDSEVLKTVRVALLDAGLAFTVSASDLEITHQYGKSSRHYKINMEMRFIDTETGYSETYSWLGAAGDSGDKALYKAMTSGEKYFLLKFFLLPTGMDVEAFEETDKEAAVPHKKPEDKENNKKTTNYDFLTAVKEMKERLFEATGEKKGEVIYRNMLGNYDAKKSNQIVAKADQKSFYRELRNRVEEEETPSEDEAEGGQKQGCPLKASSYDDIELWLNAEVKKDEDIARIEADDAYAGCLANEDWQGAIQRAYELWKEDK